MSLKLDENKQKRLGELQAITERTPEQNSELATLELEGKKGRYEELYMKNESELTDEEVTEFLTLSDELKSPRKDKKASGEPAPEEEEEGAPSKKFAGIYNSIEELAKGIMESEKERTRIEAEFPELIPQLEEFYKDSQRKVTKLVQAKKEVREDIKAKPLKDRRLHEVTSEEYEAWEKKNKMEAHAWLAQATALNEEQKKSAQKVFLKHPEFFAMAQGVIPPSEAWIKYDELAKDHPEWTALPNGPELCLAEMEKGLKPDPDPAAGGSPKPKKKEEKPDFAQGKAGGGSAGKGKMTVEEFEKLPPEEQRKHMTSTVKL